MGDIKRKPLAASGEINGHGDAAQVLDTLGGRMHVCWVGLGAGAVAATPHG